MNYEQSLAQELEFMIEQSSLNDFLESLETALRHIAASDSEFMKDWDNFANQVSEMRTNCII